VSAANICDIAEVRALIGDQIERKGSLRALARKWNVSAPYLSDILRGRRNPGPKVLKHLGLVATVERKVIYSPMP